MINMPAFDSTISGAAKSEYDFICSNVIESLSYEDLIGYFGNKQAAISYYKDALIAGYPRSAAFLINKIIRGIVGTDGLNAVERVILEDLSMLPASKMATDARIITSKIANPTDKKKILFCSAQWLTGGMERVMSTLFKELEQDYAIFLITPYDERESHIDVPEFVTNIKIANDLFTKHFDSLILSYALLLDIDIVVGVMNMFEKQLNFYELCIGTKIKTVASNHEYYFYPYKSPAHYHVVEKRLNAFMQCEAIIWPNNFSAALCSMYVSNNYVIGNPNSYAITKTWSSVPKEKTILCVGRFNDHVKRIDRILECFALVLRKVPDAKLVLVGRYENNTPIGPHDITTVNDLVRKLAIPSASLQFVGEINNPQDYYRKARVLLLTSDSEGFGMVINEAACFGVPSVCNYIPGIEDIITDGQNGFITEQGDIASMATRVAETLTNNKLWSKLSGCAQDKVLAYDSKHIGNKWRYLFNSLLETNSQAELQQILSNKLGYTVPDQQLFSKVLARELNEIFYLSIDKRGQHTINRKTRLILAKISGLPKRLKANVEYEGYIKTGSKVVVRSYRIIRRRLKI